MKETGGPNLQCFKRKTTLKMTSSYLQQVLTLSAVSRG